jgi:hypothetical protein
LSSASQGIRSPARRTANEIRDLRPRALRAGNRFPLALSRWRGEYWQLDATSIPRLETPVVPHGNENALTELAAEDSLHPISRCALPWRLLTRPPIGISFARIDAAVRAE